MTLCHFASNTHLSVDDPAAFTAVLNIIGLNTQAQRDVMTSNGITTLSDLLNFTSKDLVDVYKTNDNANRQRDALNQVIFGVVFKKRLEAIRVELDWRKSCEYPLDAAAVAAIDIDWVNELIEEQRERSEAIDAATGLADVVVPKLTKTNWSNVKTALVEKLSRLRGGFTYP